MRLSAIAIAATLVLSGCTTVVQTDAESPSFITSGPQPTTIAEYYDQQLDWRSCYGEFECAYALAPIDWNNPAKDFIRLSLLRSNQPDVEQALLVNPGGPGVSGVSWMKDYFSSIGTAKLRNSFDVVAWDPRGVGDSSAISCSDDKLKDDYLYSQPVGGLNSEADIESALAIFAALTEDCQLMTGELFTLVGTDQSVRDMDLIRDLLGQPKLNYLGYSYGTDLGAKYLASFPENAGRVVLDGAVNPLLDNVQTAQAQAEGFEKAFENYLKDCLQQNGCPFSGSVDSAKQSVAEFLLKLESSTLKTDSDRELGVWGALTGIIATLYSKESWSNLSEAFEAAFDGDGSKLLNLADFYNERYSDFGYQSNLIEANLAINCADARPIEGKYDMDEINAKINQLAPTFGRYFETSDLGCEGWPEVPKLMEYDFKVNLDTPALVIGTRFDPATPYAQAVELASILGDARLISYEGDGHTAYPGSACINSVVDDYFNAGRVPNGNISCR